MTLHQGLAFGVLAGMMLLFLWGRLRYDLVAIIALLVAVLVGIVPAGKAFTGFSDDIVIIVGSALVVSGAVARSGIIEAVLARISGRISKASSQLFLLVASVTFLSALVKNIGALAMLMPAAFQMGKKSNVSPSRFLMPMSFGSLLGGLINLAEHHRLPRARGDDGAPFPDVRLHAGRPWPGCRGAHLPSLRLPPATSG